MFIVLLEWGILLKKFCNYYRFVLWVLYFFGFVCLSVFLEGTVLCILFWEALQLVNCFWKNWVVLKRTF